jgi:amino acid adenylation domain-containing protein
MNHSKLTPVPGLEEDSYALSPVQYAMLLHALLSPHEGIYNQQIVLMLRENLDRPALTLALGNLVARHPVLRTEFDLDSHRQIVRPAVPVQLSYLDFRGTAETVEEFLAKDRRTPLDLVNSTPMRFALLRIDDDGYAFVWSSQHALMDGRSYPILLKELFELYRAYTGSQPVTMQERPPFRDYVRWLGEQDLTKAEAYWRSRLEGITAHTPVGDTFRATEDEEGAFGDVCAELPEEATSAVVAAASNCGVSFNNLIQCAWALYLARVSGGSDVLFGVVKSCRSSIPGGQDMVGLCIGTVPLLAHVQSAATLPELARALRQEQVAMRGMEQTPLPLIRKWCGIPPEEPLFESVVVFEDAPVAARLRALGGQWLQREFRLHERSNYALTLSAYLDTTLALRLGYDRRRIGDRDAEEILRRVILLIEVMAAQPDAQIQDLLRAAGPDKAGEWNDTAAEYPRDRCVHQLFAQQARLSPGATAVIFEDLAMTYGELDRLSLQLAAFLRAHGLGPGMLAAICMERSADMVVALLGILKAGAAYIPMDPAYPAERIAYMLEDAHPALLLTDSRSRARLPLAATTVIALDECRDAISATPLSACDSDGAEGLAYVIYTSGSTGRPKGVQVGHRALTNLVCSMARVPGFTSNDTLLAVTTICFDIAGLEIYLPLVSGGVLEIASAQTAADGFALRQELERRPPTVMQATPATWKMLLSAGWQGDPNLKLLCGGEALPRDLADRLAPLAREVWNLYGPTETTIWSSASRVEPGRPVTIGRPIANTQFYILDEHLRPVAPGVSGELYIAGDGVAKGYLNRPDLTRERFVPCPFGPKPAAMYRTGDIVRRSPDGEVEYLHRADRQVKLHGYRIEPGEIEHALRRLPSVSEAVVLVREDTPGDCQLVAYVVAALGSDPAPAELRRHLKTILPLYLVPGTFVRIDCLPLTPNSKVDYRALPAPVVSTPGEDKVRRPATELERRVAAVWSQVLSRSHIGLDEVFFEAGGDSLRLMEAVQRLRKETQTALTSVDMLAHPTVRTLARFLAGEAEDRPKHGCASRQRIGDLRALRHRNAGA